MHRASVSTGVFAGVFAGIFAVLGALGAKAAAEEPKSYVGEFCGAVALTDPGDEAMREHLSQWRAKPASDSEADAARPEDAATPGQMFRLPGEGAPLAFLDRRRGGCALVYGAGKAPPKVLQELSTETLPVGEHGAPSPWRKVVRARFGPPGPLRFFMKVGEREGFGLCSTIYEDLRLKDGAPATLVTVSTCHLLPNEKIDNG